MGKGAVRDNGLVRLLRVITLMAALSAGAAFGQSINSGTVSGQVTDPSGALIAGAKVRLTNAVTGFEQMAVTDTSGNFRFNSVPVNNYRLEVSAAGFNAVQQTVDVRNSVPVVANIALNIATESSTVTVQATAAAVETDTTSHQDVDSSAFSKLPVFSPGAGLSDAITYSTGAVAADANGFFHPLGDHAQTTFVIDGQPVSDQQSKLFSTQIPLNALQGMELITGSPDAQYGDKTSLVVNATTRSGLGATKPYGSFDSSWGSFGTCSGSATLGFGTPNFGNFLALNVSRSGRFLDTPEFLPIHDIGNNGSIFDRVDWQPGPQDVFHLDLFTRAELVSGAQQLRSIDAGSEAARAELERRAGLPAHLQRSHLAYGKSVRAPRPAQLLSEPRSVRRYAGDRVPKSRSDELWREGRSGVHSRPPRHQDRDPDPADPAAGELPVRHHQSDV